MSEKWIQTTLGAATRIKQGRYLSKAEMAEAKSIDSPFPVHGANGIIGWISKALYTHGVPLVTCRGSNCGMILWADGPLWVSNNAMAILPEESLDLRFLYFHLLNSPPYEFVSGSAQPQITMGDLSKKKLTFPPLSEQRAIAATLGALDDKIELNRRMNATLESMAQALFRDWFVDFGPVRRKLDGATDPIAILGYAGEQAAPLAVRFPDSFAENGLPEGWIERPVSEFGKLKGGKQLPKTEFVNSGEFPVFGGAGHMGHTDKFNAEGYVITVGRVGAYCGNFVAHRGKAWVNNNASVFHLVGSTQGEWFFLALRELNLEPIKKGAAQPFVSNGDINDLPLIEPGQALREATNQILATLIQKIEANYQENQTLAATRDLLLPKLMSGEICVRETEDMVEDAG